MDVNTLYLPPLRGAVLFACGLDRGAVSVETLAEFAGVPVTRAKAFASILVARKAIRETKLGFVRGVEWEEWSGKPSRTRPVKSAIQASAAAEMETMRRAVSIRVKTELLRRGWSFYELEQRTGISHKFVERLTKRCQPPPVCQLVLIARCLETSIEQLTAPLVAVQGSTAYFKR